MTTGDIDYRIAKMLIKTYGIVDVEERPAAYDFTLGNGDTLTLMPGDRDWPDTWRRDPPGAQA